MAYGPPPGYPTPPPPSGWGTPGWGAAGWDGSASTRRRGLLSGIGLEIGVAVTALLGAVFACLDYYEYRPTGLLAADCARLRRGPEALRAFCHGGLGLSARNSAIGTVATVFLLLAGVLALRSIVASRARVEPDEPTLLRVRADILAAAGVGALLTLVAGLDVPRWQAATLTAGARGFYRADIEDGHGWSFWVVLVLALLCLALAIVRTLLAAGRIRPDRPRPDVPPPAPYVQQVSVPTSYGQTPTGYVPPPNSYPPRG